MLHEQFHRTSEGGRARRGQVRPAGWADPGDPADPAGPASPVGPTAPRNAGRQGRADHPLRVSITLAAGLLLLLAGPASAIEWQVPLDIRNGAAMRDTIRFGVHPAATNGIDPGLGEVELPPWPPSSLFEVRFQLSGTEGTTLDLRDTTHVQRFHTIKWQTGQGGYPVTVRWNRAALPYASLYISDGYGGVFIPRTNMYDVDSLVVPPSLSFVKLLTLDITPGVSPGAWPALDPIPGATIYRGQQFPERHLDDYVFDPDTPDASLQWRVTENQVLVFDIDPERVLRVSAPPGWTGSETVTLTAEDPQHHAAQTQVSFTVRPGGLPSWTVPVQVRNAAAESRTVTFGIDPEATDGIDGALGEVELPPWPPEAAFDARFLLPDELTTSSKDLRMSEPIQIVYHLRWQAGAGGYPVTVEWSPDLPLGEFVVEDEMGGVFIPGRSMRDSSRIVIPPNLDYVTGLKITATAAVDTVAPLGPTSFHLIEAQSGALVLGWVPCQEEHFAYYEIAYSESDPMAEPVYYWDWTEDAALMGISDSSTVFQPRYPGPTFFLWIRAWDSFGNCGPWGKLVDIAAVPDLPIPAEGTLQKVKIWPNPVGEGVWIQWRPAGDGATRLSLFDLGGRLVRTGDVPVSSGTTAGATFWACRREKGSSLAPGIYFLRLEQGRTVEVRKLTVAP
jgi:hypothetical protein